MFWTSTAFPVGQLFFTADGSTLTGLWMESHRALPCCSSGLYRDESPVFQETKAWLGAYFSDRPLPSLPELQPEGTPFQLSVWALLQEIPYGASTTYGAISKSLQEQGISSSPQAVGGAVGRNPISILIPCHRVLGADGSLTGYAGGLAVKRRLLQLEGIRP